MCKEILPGDSFKVNSQIFARLSPLLAPIMSRVDIYTHYFFVPTRLLWDEFETFITGGEDGLQQPVPPEVPSSILTSYANPVTNSYEGSLCDYLGIPENFMNSDGESISDLPFRAIAKIWNDWYRDQNLQEEIDINKDKSGLIDTNDLKGNSDHRYQVQYRAYKKDYFTSALPWAQRGAQVTLPLKTSFNLTNNEPFLLSQYSNVKRKGHLAAEGNAASGSNMYDHNVKFRTNDAFQDQNPHNIELDPTAFEVDSQGPTVTELRRSLRVQEWLEASARGGARYIEQLLTHFGVRSSDARLQRSELLGGGRSPIIVSEVVQTSGTEVDNDNWTPQGTLAGKGVTAQSVHGFKKYFEEHGFLVCLVSILPKATYQQGLDRMWQRRDKFDYAWPEFANIGEQPIYNKELYYQTVHSSQYPTGVHNEEIFGYTPRYAEYKYAQSTIHGQFRKSLNFWHLGRIFNKLPGLNGDFVSCKPDDGFSRAFAVEDTDHFMIQIYHDIKAKRVLPYYGTPQI